MVYKELIAYLLYKMTIDQFNSLDELDQAQATWKAIPIKSVVIGAEKFLLYYRDGFYIEVTYNCHNNIIESFTPVFNTDDLITYYDDHDITELTCLL